MSTILKTHDALNRRLRAGEARPRGERVYRQPNDLFILEALHRLGPQTTEALYRLLYPLYKDKHSLLIRLRKLRHEQEASDYGGPLIFYPSQQRRGATLPDNNLAVYDILARGEKLLKNAGLWRDNHPTTKNQEWKHDFMRSTIIASIAIAAKANGAEFLYPDQVLDGLKLPFDLPPCEYKADNGMKIRTGAKLRPDGFFALKYANGVKRIFLIEADCGTEPNESDNIERKSHKAPSTR
jgi:Replication-relaxation